ncbi:flagellar hook-length control protein FliK [Limoniibacter endophyticus]|uniref:Flagellar hook-length control protein-like C-terminal domain-containing protein n=1 Tax=Limoniibacter endophyticus TaxID=1565040 RepID=A0A8J3DMQ7_9HYPH|nr:flagellar hook-length control protein FliK [Limoniibacter endophyticus]GHC64509.1 hypothetical protein GCM10010136_06520 [Limoniibacter endophyticus]
MPTVTRNTDLLSAFTVPAKSGSGERRSDEGFAEALKEKGQDAASRASLHVVPTETAAQDTMSETTFGAKTSLVERLSRSFAERGNGTEKEKGDAQGFEIPDHNAAPLGKAEITPGNTKAEDELNDSLLVESAKLEPSAIQSSAAAITAEQQNVPVDAGADASARIPLIISNSEMPGLRITIRELRKDTAESKDRIFLSSLLNQTASNDAQQTLAMPGKTGEATNAAIGNGPNFAKNQRQATGLSFDSSLKNDPAPRDPIKIEVVSNQSIPTPQRLGDTASGLLQQLSAQLTQPVAASVPAQQVHQGQATVSSATHLLKVNLNPAELGAVVASLHLSGSHLKVAIQTESVEAYRQLSMDSDALVKALQSMGYDVDGVTVQPPQAMQQSQARADGSQAGHPGFANHDDTQFTSQQGRSDEQSQHENRSGVERNIAASSEQTAQTGDGPERSGLSDSTRYI